MLTFDDGGSGFDLTLLILQQAQFRNALNGCDIIKILILCNARGCCSDPLINRSEIGEWSARRGLLRNADGQISYFTDA